MSERRQITAFIRRFDLSENASPEKLTFEISTKMDYGALKRELYDALGVSECNRVIKLRNAEGCLVTLPSILNENETFTIDVTNVNYSTKNNNNLLQDAYLDAIHQKLSNMEYRVSQAEVLVPQLQTRRQNHMETTVNTLSNRVSFLSRRIDELMPLQWHSKMPTA